MQTVKQLIAELQKLDGDLAVQVAAVTPDGTVQTYDVAGVTAGPADYGQQAVISLS
jgi:hypothetical protein